MVGRAAREVPREDGGVSRMCPTSGCSSASADRRGLRETCETLIDPCRKWAMELALGRDVGTLRE
jgi:hypothetical protein